MVSVTLGLIYTGTCLGKKNIYGSLVLQKVTGLLRDGEDWWQPANHRTRFVESQSDQMAWEVELEKKELLQVSLAQFLLSWWRFIANRPVARAEMYKEFGAQCARGMKREGTPQHSAGFTACGCIRMLSLRDGEALSKSWSEFLIPCLQNRVMSLCPACLIRLLGGTNGLVLRKKYFVNTYVLCKCND